MTRPWLENYPQNVPAEIDAGEYASMADLLRASFARHGAAIAFSNLGARMTFAEVDALSRCFAAYLRSELGLGKGERVAVMLPNLLQSPVTLFGILRAGLTAVNVNPLYTPHELEHQLRDSGASVLVVLDHFAHTAAAVISKTAVKAVIVTRLADHLPPIKRSVTNFIVKHVKRLVPAWHIEGAVAYRAALERGRALAYDDPVVDGQDLAFLQYTGGTTGVAKGAMLTHRNIVSNVLQAMAWLRPFYNPRDGDAVTPLPLYHIFALTANLFLFIALGAHNVLITNPRDLPAFVHELRRVRLVFFTGVNTLFNALLRSPKFAAVDFSHLKISLAGGMAVQADVAERWQKATGCAVSQGYGLTEASPIVTANVPGDGFNGSVGLPLPSTEVCIIDDADRQLDIGQVGEICVRGPQVMPGYWQRPEETAAVFVGDGWLRTGDIGRLDADGYLFIEDRKKDVIVVSGFKVYPNEVEDALTQHPDIVEAAVVGIPSEHSGEAVKAFVVTKNKQLSAAAVIAYCRTELTGYKVPAEIEFVDELPKSNVGKVLRRELKEREDARSSKRRA